MCRPCTVRQLRTATSTHISVNITTCDIWQTTARLECECLLTTERLAAVTSPDLCTSIQTLLAGGAGRWATDTVTTARLTGDDDTVAETRALIERRVDDMVPSDRGDDTWRPNAPIEQHVDARVPATTRWPRPPRADRAARHGPSCQRPRRRDGAGSCGVGRSRPIRGNSRTGRYQSPGRRVTPSVIVLTHSPRL